MEKNRAYWMSPRASLLRAIFALVTSHLLFLGEAPAQTAMPSASNSPSSLTFAPQRIGTSSPPQPVTLTNAGTAPLLINSIRIVQNTATGAVRVSDFTLTSGCRITGGGATALAPGASCVLNVTFTPSAGAAGTRSANLVFSDNASGSPQSVPLSGTAVPSAPAVGLAPASLTFASQLIGTSSAPQPVTLTNAGTAPLLINSIRIVQNTATGAARVSDFTLTSGCRITGGAATVLAPGTSCVLNVTFTPRAGAAGTRSANLVFSDNASGSPQTVALNGLAASSGVAVAGIAPAALTFASQVVGTTSALQSLTLANTGSASLAISSVSLTGINPGDFAIATNSCTSTLVAGASCAIGITFTASTTGTRSGSLSISSNDPAHPTLTVSLTGTGSAAAPVITSIAPNTGLAGAAFPITITGTNLTGATAVNVPAGISVSTLTPVSAFSVTATFTIAPSAVAGPYAVSVTTPGGTSNTLVFTVFAPTAGIAPVALTFASRVVGTTSAPQILTLSNTGSVPLASIAVLISGDFARAPGPSSNCGATLAAGVTCTIGVTFTPSTTGTRSGSLSVSSNDPANPTLTVALTGTGYAVNLVSIALTPVNASVPLGASQQFTATGTYSDGSTQALSSGLTWSSSAPSVAAISAGLATTPTTGCGGPTTISAAMGALSASTALTVFVPGGISCSGDTVAARDPHTSNQLNNGLVLIAGGLGVPGQSSSALSSAELYSAATGTSVAAASMNAAHAYHTATVLNDGRVLVAGGVDVTGVATGASEIYDPIANTFTVTGALLVARQQHSATLLADGRVLVTGGLDSTGVALSSAEIYDPTAQAFTTVNSANGALANARYAHTATRLATGTVLIAGGYGSGAVALASAEIFDPACTCFASSAAAQANLGTPRTLHTATLLANGTVLFAGGLDGTGLALASAELYDPVKGVFAPTTGPGATATTMTVPRYGHSATLLTNGTVLVAGGNGGGTSGVLGSLDIYDATSGNPTSGTFLAAATASLQYPRYLHNATLLGTGAVLIDGGVDGANAALAHTEIYTPASTIPQGLTGFIALFPSVYAVSGAPPIFPGIVPVGSMIQLDASAFFGAVDEPLLAVTWSSSDQTVLTIGSDPANMGRAYAIKPGTVTVQACTGSGANDCAIQSVTAVAPSGPGPVPNFTQPISASPAIIGTSNLWGNVLVENVAGSAPLTVYSVSIGGASPATDTAAFTVSDHCSQSIAPGSYAPYADANSCVLQIYFSPTVPGPHTATLTVTDNAGTQTLVLSGTVLAPNLSISASAFVFPAQLVGTATAFAAAVALVDNIGTAQATLGPGTVTITGPNASEFTLQTGPGGLCNSPGTVLPVNVSCSLFVTFTPSAVGLRSATLNVTDPQDGQVLQLALSGTGIGALPPTLTTISVSPLLTTVILGNAQQYAAMGTYSDGSTLDLTTQVAWSTSPGGIGTFNPSGAANSGLLTTAADGTATVTATLGSVSGSSILNVKSLTAVNVTALGAPSGLLTLLLGTTQQFAATGLYSDGSTIDLTAQAVWAAPATIATFNASGVPGSGLLTAVGDGTAAVTATLGALSGSLALNVKSLTGVTVTPNGLTVAPGNSLQFTATGIYSDGSAQNLSAAVAWTSTPASAVSATGLVSSAPVGTVTITAILGTLSGSANLNVVPPGSFISAGAMLTTRSSHSATLMPNGKALIVGGSLGTPGAELGGQNVDLYDPASNSFASFGATPFHGHAYHTATLLDDGSILIAGGIDETGATTSIVEIYSPRAGGFTQVGSLQNARRGHTATLLSNGTVLIAGGIDALGNSLASAELYIPAQQSFSFVGSLVTARHEHTATLLNTGMVLIAGGFNSLYATPVAGAELFDPTALTFAPATASAGGAVNMATARYQHTATLLDGGRVLLAGGASDAAGTPLASAELYDPVAGTFADSGVTMSSPRIAHTATLLTSGKVLLAGGYADTGGTINSSADLFDAGLSPPVLQPTIGAMLQGAAQHTATRLLNGNVLVAGGIAATSGVPPATSFAELYVPDSLVPANLAGIVVTPNPVPGLVIGGVAQLVATGGFLAPAATPQQLASVIWTSSDYNPTTATVLPTNTVVLVTNDATNSGRVLALGGGSSQITASPGPTPPAGSTGSTIATINANTVQSIQIGNPAAPNPATVALGATIQFTATALLADGVTLVDVTKQVVWSALPGATISSAGLATGTSVGLSGVTAKLSGVPIASASLTVTNPALLSVTITPSSANVPLGLGQQFTLMATYTNGSVDLTSAATWSVANPLVVVSPFAVPGFAQTVLPQTVGATQTTVTAAVSPDAYGNLISQSVTLTETAPVLATIQTLPTPVTMAIGSQQQFSAAAYDSAGNSVPPTQLPPLLWVAGYAFGIQSNVYGEVHVSLNGKVTATGCGTGTIVAIAGNTVASTSARFQITEAPIAGGFSCSSPTPPDQGRQNHTATTLTDGTVLVAGGSGNDNSYPQNSTLRYDATGMNPVADMPLQAARARHTATLLPSGAVLITGGYYSSPFSALDADGVWATAEVYTPGSGSTPSSSTLLASTMLVPRYCHAATWIPTLGKVLIVGGVTGLNTAGSPVSTNLTELFDPASNTFAQTMYLKPLAPFPGLVPSTLGYRYACPTATWMPTVNKVLITGASNFAELFDPVAQTFTFTSGTMLTYGMVGHTATWDPAIAKVVIAGGSDMPSVVQFYDPATDAFSAGPSFNVGRMFHTATLLPDYRILFVGGETTSGIAGGPEVRSAEIFDPVANTISFTTDSVTGFVTNMDSPREDHAAALLTNGTVLITGGYDYSHHGTQGTAEIYTPGPPPTGVAASAIDVLPHTGDTGIHWYGAWEFVAMASGHRWSSAAWCMTIDPPNNFFLGSLEFYLDTFGYLDMYAIGQQATPIAGAFMAADNCTTPKYASPVVNFSGQ